VHSAGLAFGPRLNPIGHGGLLVRWPEAGQRPVDAANGQATRAHRGWSRRGGTGGQGSPVAPVQRGRRREYEDGEGRSSGKEDGYTAHQGGLGSDEVGDGEARRSSRGGGAR
jgi:hypothetical protein